MRMWFSLRPWVMLLVQIRSAEFFAPLTAAKYGQKFYRKMKTPAGSTSSSIRIIRTSYSRHSGRRGDSHGVAQAAAPAAEFIGREVMVGRGNVSRQMDLPAESLGRSA